MSRICILCSVPLKPAAHACLIEMLFTVHQRSMKRKEKEGLMGSGMYIYLTQYAEKQPQCGAMHNVTME